MKKRILAALICAAALTAAGCAGQANGTPGKETEAAGAGDTAPAENTVEEESAASVKTAATAAKAEESAEAGTTAGENAPDKESAAQAKGEKYESEDGWSVRYDSELVEAEETYDAVVFTYIGECSGTNSIGISYIPNTSTDIVLADKMADHEDSQIERSEGYWGGRTDIWAFSVDVIPEWSATLGYTAVEYDDGVLLVERRGYKETDEALGTQIADTMAAILDSFEFKEFKPQTEYDYIPGKYTLSSTTPVSGKDANADKTSDGSGSEEVTAGDYPKEILLREDHTGTITIQDKVDIIWYSRDSLIRENQPGGNTYYFNIEGDYLYLQQGEDYIKFVKDTSGGAAKETKAESKKDKKDGGTAGFATYESEEGWLVYYDKNEIDVSEKWGEVDFAYAGSSEDTDMLRFKYLGYDSTEEALRDVTGVYDLSGLAITEGFLGGRHDAWGFTVNIAADEEGANTEQTFTAVEHNGGTLLIERVIDASHSEEEKAKINKALDDLLNTFMFTRHDPQTEFEDVPGTYLINDKILPRDASNYPSAVKLNADHTGVFKGSPNVEIVWHARDGIIREAAPDGASYSYRLDDDTLYLTMDGEQVEFNREETEDDW